MWVRSSGPRVVPSACLRRLCCRPRPVTRQEASLARLLVTASAADSLIRSVLALRPRCLGIDLNQRLISDEKRGGLHYNPYFPGGAIAMHKMLNDGAIEYEDGTPATEAEMGKDVVSFLSWAAEPEMEERKLEPNADLAGEVTST